MKALLPTTALAALTTLLAGCATSQPATSNPFRPYVERPDYDHAMVCDLRHDDLQRCESVIKQLCGARGFLDLRIRPLREPGASVDSSTHRLLQLQCKPRA